MIHPILLLTQAAISAIIISAVYGIYRQVKIEDVRLRLRFLIAAFIAFFIGLVFHASAEENFFPSASLLFEHVFGIIFFVLLGATGLLHFMEKERIKTIVSATYVLVGAMLFGAAALLLYFFAAGLEFYMSARAVVMAHAAQVLLLLAVTALILRRILATHSPLSLRALHRRYPFGVAAALMMFGVAAHITTVSVDPNFQHRLSFFESIFALPALAIVASYILFTYKNQVYFFGVGHVEGAKCSCFYCIARRGEEKQVRSLQESLNHVIRQVYYTPVDIGIGGREVMFSEFLSRTNLHDIFKRHEMELDEDKFLSASMRYEFLHELSLHVLKFFTEHKELVNEAQFYHLISFLDSVHACQPQDFDFRQQWLLLSELAKNLGAKAEQHIDKLSSRDAEATFSYFEEVHPTGIRKLDEAFGGAETHQCVLNITREVPALKILHPVIKSCLHGWRNVIYVASEPVAKIKKELEEEESYLQENRLKIITILPGAEESENGIYVVSSVQKLTEAIKRCLSSFPLSTVFVVLDLTPIAISEDVRVVRELVNWLCELRYSSKMVICAAVSQNVQPIYIDILRGGADIIIAHEIVDGNPVSKILKPERSRDEEAALEKELFDLLLFVYRENSKGKKPAIGDVSSAMAITPKTAKRRMSLLESRGMIKLERWGRYKIAEITPRGRELVLQTGG